ncbi:hypothetical protein [Kribbella sp. NPDC000426]
MSSPQVLRGCGRRGSAAVRRRRVGLGVRREVAPVWRPGSAGG